MFEVIRVPYLLIDSRRRMKNITDDIINGVFHSGKCLSGMFSISLAALREPRSTGI